MATDSRHVPREGLPAPEPFHSLVPPRNVRQIRESAAAPEPRGTFGFSCHLFVSIAKKWLTRESSHGAVTNKRSPRRFAACDLRGGGRQQQAEPGPDSIVCLLIVVKEALLIFSASLAIHFLRLSQQSEERLPAHGPAVRGRLTSAWM